MLGLLFQAWGKIGIIGYISMDVEVIVEVKKFLPVTEMNDSICLT